VCRSILLLRARREGVAKALRSLLSAAGHQHHPRCRAPCTSTKVFPLPCARAELEPSAAAIRSCLIYARHKFLLESERSQSTRGVVRDCRHMQGLGKKLRVEWCSLIASAVRHFSYESVLITRAERDGPDPSANGFQWLTCRGSLSVLRKCGLKREDRAPYFPKWSNIELSTAGQAGLSSRPSEMIAVRGDSLTNFLRWKRRTPERSD
jgi:hypothetical protein